MKVHCLLYALILLLLLTGCQTPEVISGKLILHGEHIQPSGSAFDGELLLLGGAFTQQTGSTIQGSIHMAGGLAHLSGTVNGSVTVLDGALTLAPEAVLLGDLNILGGSITQSTDTRIDGQVNRRSAGTPPAESLPVALPGGMVARLLVEVPLLALVGALAARYYPAQMRVLKQTLATRPLVCTATGLLAAVAGLSLAIVMGYTLLLLPASFLLLAFLLFAATVGAAPVALWLGRSILHRLRPSPCPDTWSAVLGMLLLAGLAELLRFVPIIGGLLAIALLLTALGAALLTRFGALELPPAAKTIAVDAEEQDSDTAR